MGAFRLLQPLRRFRLRAGAAAGAGRSAPRRRRQARLRRLRQNGGGFGGQPVRSLNAIFRSAPCSAITTIMAFSAARSRSAAVGAVRSMNLSAAAEGARVRQLAIMRRQRRSSLPQRRKRRARSSMLSCGASATACGRNACQRLLPCRRGSVGYPQRQHIALSLGPSRTTACDAPTLADGRSRGRPGGGSRHIAGGASSVMAFRTRFIEQREGEMLGGRRRRGGVTHRQRGVAVQPFCAGASAASRWGLAAAFVAGPPIATPLLQVCAFANYGARLWQRRSAASGDRRRSKWV
ncbi:hypothetical protein M8494_31025 [Serratia ureilytica]